MFCVLFSSDFLYKSIYCRYSFAIQMGSHNICLYKDVDKKYTDCNLKTTKFLDRTLIEVCAVIRSNTVFQKVVFAWRFILKK